MHHSDLNACSTAPRPAFSLTLSSPLSKQYVESPAHLSPLFDSFTAHLRARAPALVTAGDGVEASAPPQSSSQKTSSLKSDSGASLPRRTSRCVTSITVGEGRSEMCRFHSLHAFATASTLDPVDGEFVRGVTVRVEFTNHGGGGNISGGSGKR